MLVGIKDGTLETTRARDITKMAAQINESFYSEVKVAKTQMELGREAQALGSLEINSKPE